MKKYLAAILLVIMVLSVSCATTAPVSKVCPPPENKPSFICTKSAELKVTPEQVYGWIFSATAIAAVIDIADIDTICAFKKKISVWYVDVYPITYDSVIAKALEELKLIDDPRKVALIKSILNQNITMYASPQLIDEYDDWMVRAGSNKFDLDMGCK